MLGIERRHGMGPYRMACAMNGSPSATELASPIISHPDRAACVAIRSTVYVQATITRNKLCGSEAGKERGGTHQARELAEENIKRTSLESIELNGCECVILAVVGFQVAETEIEGDSADKTTHSSELVCRANSNYTPKVV